MENETNKDDGVPRGPKARNAAGRAAIKLFAVGNLALGALLGANNTLGIILLVLAVALMYAIVSGYRGISRGVAEDKEDAERAAPTTQDNFVLCNDPNCAACAIRRAMQKVGVAFAHIGPVSHFGARPTDRMGGPVH